MEIDERGRFVPRPESERFWEKVEKTDTCWLWTSVIDLNGYAVFKVKRDGKHKYVKAHRWAYEDEVGIVPEELTLDHLCRVRHCVNPAHLEPVTMGENNRRAVGNCFQVNALKTNCPQGHPYNKANTYVTPTGHRQCRICNLAAGVRYRAKRPKQPKPRRYWNAEKTHCPAGHPYDETNTYIRPSGARGCRACIRESQRELMRRRKRDSDA